MLIEELQQAASLDANIKKLKGYKTAYRIRIGEYRIGFVLEKNTIKLSQVIIEKKFTVIFHKCHPSRSE